MTNVEAFNKIKVLIDKYVAPANKDALANATSDTKFLADLKINSARLVDIILDMETEFDITVSDDEAETIRTLGSAADLIAAKTNG